ncbi:PepSY-associated TM helix domain-containing protein [Thermithiobacillus plumbiphilus]|uniref:PepSY-associated TM helix domain-containing protein n=1 Tax=Thermithiobacillus plumbiphilus TaxID=1729899 RepID=A0ABU9D4V4_9PROT
MAIRAWILRLHRWLGLALFALLTLQCASGVLIQFGSDIERFILPEVMRAATPGTALALETQATRAAQLGIGTTTAQAAGYVATRVIPGVPAESVTMVRMESATAEPREIEVFVDPVSGAVHGWRDHDARGLDRLHLMPTLNDLHTELLSGEAAQSLLAVVAALWLPLAAAGVFITLPRRFAWARWKRMWAIRNVDTDAHRASGLWLSAFALILAATTVLMVFDDEVFGDIRYPADTRAAQAIGFDAAAQRAQIALGVEATQYRPRVIRHEAGDGRYRVELRHAAQGTWQRPDERIYLAATDGAVIGRQGWLAASGAQQLRALSLFAHTGEILGLAGRWLFVVAGLALATHFVFGFRGWLRRRRARLQDQALPQV